MEERRALAQRSVEAVPQGAAAERGGRVFHSREVGYFSIGGSLGWNQDWFSDWSMCDGGCAAVTACDLCILLARQPQFSALYPGDPLHVTREAYEAFAQKMKPYLHPCWQGIDTLERYLSGLTAYWQDVGVPGLQGVGLPGSAPWEQARDLVKEQVDAGLLVPCLLLHHKNFLFQDFAWHWFNLAGYGELDGEFCVKAVTYGNALWLSLRELWDTGHQRKGGLIRLQTR